jgi:hypothetical protein
MRSPALTLAADFWKRHLLGFSAIGGLVLVFAIVCIVSQVTQTDATHYSIWFVVGLCYVVGVFAYGFEARMESPESGFPVRLLLLPVRTSVLVGSSMLQGMLIVVVLWLCWQHIVLQPAGIEIPRWWPVMLAAMVAICQAILWFPFGLPWIRLFVASVIIIALIRVTAIYHSLLESLGVPEKWIANQDHQDIVLSGAAAILVPVSFLVSWAGVSRSRRGDSFVWLPTWRTNHRPSEIRRARRPFASAIRAQVWYEWRLRGRGYVVTVAVLLTLIMGLALLFESSERRSDYGLIFFYIPPLIAAFWGSQMGSSGESIRSTSLATFVATRPLSEIEMVSAKLRAVTRTAVITWAIVLVVAGVWFWINSGYDRLVLTWEAYKEKYGPEQTSGFTALLAFGLVFGTWRALAANLWVGLSGRTWLVPAHTIFIALLLLQTLVEWSAIQSDPIRAHRFLVCLPWIVGILLISKTLITLWSLRESQRRGQLKVETAIKLVSIWLVAALGLIAVFAWLVPATLVSVQRLIFIIVLYLPLARLASAPLALAWNRHR